MTNPPGEGQPPEDPYQDPNQSSGQEGPGGPGYWEQQQGYPYPPPGYGYPQHGAPMQYAPDHPQATTVLVIGIVGIVVCGGLLSPIAWVMGKRALNEIEAAHGQIGGRGAAQAGYILGIIGTCLLVFWVLAFLAWLLFVIAFIGLGTAASY
jgi:hypothetical protein